MTTFSKKNINDVMGYVATYLAPIRQRTERLSRVKLDVGIARALSDDVSHKISEYIDCFIEVATSPY